MQSVMKHSFAQIPQANIGRSSFDRSSGSKTTIDADRLYPVYWDVVMPGDTVKINPSFFARMATPINPIMDNLFFEWFWFEVPMRIMWDNWDKFLGAQDNPGDSIDYTIPQLTAASGTIEGTLADYFEMPLTTGYQANAFLHRAYFMIYNQWFRDQNIIGDWIEQKGNGPDNFTTYNVSPLKRGKRHDYFTSCTPWAQKGDAVTMPLGTSAPLTTDSSAAARSLTVKAPNIGSGDYTLDSSGSNLLSKATTGQDALYADLSNATAATINAMRLAVTTQQFLERDARGGTRINEIILSHFNVRSLDARVQIPEYLGGGSQPVGINTVPQTSSTDATTPQGNVAAFGTMSSSGQGGFVKSFTEHAVLMCIVNVRADLTYQQGLNRFLTMQTRYDLFWPEFQNIGDQAVLRKEIMWTNTSADDDVFGYQERDAHWKHKQSAITGKFRSNATGTLDPWHLSEDFATQPTLNQTFIESNTPMARVEAVSSEPDFIVDMHFQANYTRPMQLYSEPGLARF